jgi:hypothetical protein
VGLKITTLSKDWQSTESCMWTSQSTAPARHWIQAYKIIIFIRGDHSPCSNLSRSKKNYNRRVDLNRDIFLEFPARSLVPKFVDMTYVWNKDPKHRWIELQLLECCWHPDPNSKIPQLQTNSNTWGIACLPPGRDECNVFSGRNEEILIIQNSNH